MGNVNKKSKKGKSRGNTPHAPEASPVSSRNVIAILPNQSQKNIKICACENAFEIKEKALGADAPNLSNCEVVLWYEENHLVVMNDEEELGDKLQLFDHIIIREKQLLASGNQDMDNAIKIKRRN